MNPVLILALYLAAINLLTARVTAHDKKAARRGERRIPESHLLFLAAMGGALGEWIAMYAVRHKTKKLKFTLGVPLILAAQIALLILLFVGGVL